MQTATMMVHKNYIKTKRDNSCALYGLLMRMMAFLSL